MVMAATIPIIVGGAAGSVSRTSGACPDEGRPGSQSGQATLEVYRLMDNLMASFFTEAASATGVTPAPSLQVGSPCTLR
eukprot:NODE_4034_length_379_cov_95.296970_g3594_i0.p1 GENE.NODE_4034_length_379_cov_95.296970_g3594_i0~~NODE_4034_length_379_cov_95.296970_g3594_i0.p1  ORF type:complete len:79 (-),score=13.61 NODE_4034_length_379_cov_95.296970_g3594_i0:7-243(-)